MFEIYDVGFGGFCDDDKVNTVESLSEALYLCKSYQAQVGYPAQDIYIVLCTETGEEYYSDGTKVPEKLRYLRKKVVKCSGCEYKCKVNCANCRNANIVEPDFDPTHGLEYLGW